MKLTAYISGPISAHLETDKNEPAFREMENKLKAMGYNTIVPHDINPLNDMDGDWHMHMRADLIAMLQHADFVVTLPNWEISKGATDEKCIANRLSIPVIPHTNIKPAIQMFWPEDAVFVTKTMSNV